MKVKVAMTVALALSVVSSPVLAGRAAWHEWRNLTAGELSVLRPHPARDG